MTGSSAEWPQAASCDSIQVSRELHRKTGAQSFDTLCADTTPMGLDDLAGNRQPKARATSPPHTRLVNLIESLKNPQQILLWDAGAIVGKPNRPPGDRFALPGSRRFPRPRHLEHA